ncbi:MAG: hypothetical protein H6607_05525 [Flavobacteriales bacterium]|nr:hypothetical protein [Flavobacteriales bacterium]
MKAPKNILPDELLKNGLQGYEAGFENADWQNMLNLLEEDGISPILVPIEEKKSTVFNFKNILIMTLLATISAAVLWMSNFNNNTAINQTENQNATPLTNFVSPDLSSEKIPEEKSNIPKQTMDYPSKNSVSTQVLDDAPSQQESDESTEKVVEAEETSSNTADNSEKENEIFNDPIVPIEGELPPVDQVQNPDSTKFWKTVTTRYWVDTTYRWIYEKPKYDIEQGWIGLHYTNQTMQDTMAWNSIGRRSATHGFNLQFMSGNLLPGEFLAIYGGLDWGMQFYGRNDKDEVEINSANKDKGFSQLRTHGNDLYATAHIEWAQFRLVPYLNGSIGTRILTTGQTVSQLLSSTEYESSTDHHIFTSAAFSTKFGAGLKVKLTPRLYLDGRYEFVTTEPLKVVDYNNTAFNGLDYSLGFKNLKMDASQFRIGIVVDLSEDKAKKIVNVPGHYEETTQMFYIDSSDSSKVFSPCPCGPCDKRKSTSNNSSGSNWEFNGGNNQNNDIFVPRRGGSSGGGSGKSGFPGYGKPPVKN